MLEFESPSKVDDFIKCLKQEASKWAFILNSMKCNAVAVSSLAYWLFDDNPDNWRGVLQEKLDNKQLEFLACSGRGSIILHYIDLLVWGYFKDTEHRITVFHSIIARHARNDLILDYILANFAKLISR